MSSEGFRRLRNEHGFTADDVERAVVHASAMQMRMCAIPEPVTGLEAKFSLRHTAAMVLAGVDTSGIESFADDGMTRPDVLDARARVTVRTDREPGGPTPVTVRLHTSEGKVAWSGNEVESFQVFTATEQKLSRYFVDQVARQLRAAAPGQVPTL